MEGTHLINRSVRVRSQESIYKVLDAAGGTALCQAVDTGAMAVFPITDLTPHSPLLRHVGSALSALSWNSSVGREMAAPFYLLAGVLGAGAGVGTTLLFLDGAWAALLGYLVGGVVGVLGSALWVSAAPATQPQARRRNVTGASLQMAGSKTSP